MAGRCRYVDEQDFKDFKDNFHLMIETFNHNVTDIKNDSNFMKTMVRKLDMGMILMKQEVKAVKWLVIWIMGIISAIVIAAVIGSIKG